VLSAIVSAAAVVAMSITVMGWDVHREFLETVLGSHLTGTLTLQNPFSPTFQSFDALFRRLFVPDPVLNPVPVLNIPILYPLLKGLVTVLVLGSVLWTIRDFWKRGDPGADALAVSLIVFGAVLLTPAGATYHMLLLWLPVLLVVSSPLRRQFPRMAIMLLAGYTVIGFLPYSLFSGIGRTGALAVLAFPRLWLLAALFAILLGMAARFRTETPMGGET
jgi:hypothetical protein